MQNREKDIADMQCSVFREAQRKWNLTGAECAEVFQKYQLLEFIKNCYEILHVSSYEHVVYEMEDILKTKGIKYGK